MDNREPNSSSRFILVIALAAAALAMLVLATQVEMPLRAILMAIAFSDIIFIILLQLGHILPGGKR